LGNRIQHALRAYTPKDQKAVRVAAQSFRANPEFSTEQAIMELGTGEALVSVLDEKGAPTIVQRARMLFPLSQIGAINDTQRQIIIHQSRIFGKYDKAFDRESAFETLLLLAEKAKAEAEKAKADAEKAKADAEKAKLKAKEEKEKEKERAKAAKKTSSTTGKILSTAATTAARTAAREITKSIVGGSSKKKSSSGGILGSFVRGILGNLLK
jgi:hypothetical protein